MLRRLNFRSLFSTVTLSTVLALGGACATDTAIEDGVDDHVTSGKNDNGEQLSPLEVVKVLDFVNRASAAELQNDVGLSKRVAQGIANHRLGADGAANTDDDDPFDTLGELDAVPYVGAKAIQRLSDFVANHSGVTLSRHDVSVLFPLPKDGESLWSPSLPAKGGVLLPKSVVDKIPEAITREIPKAKQWEALSIVGVRFDPCFRTTVGAACQPQIRLVLQIFDAKEQYFYDGAIHALYNLSASEWSALAAELEVLADATPENRTDEGLGVSPALAAQGLAGPYAASLQKLVTKYAGQSNLARMTFMSRTLSRETQWHFGGFHIKAAAATGFPAPGPIEIFGSDEQQQTLSQSGFFGDFAFTVSPAIADEAGLPGLKGNLGKLTKAERKSVHDWSMRHETPTETAPDDTDCTSCHVAGHVSRALEELDASLLLDARVKARGPRRTSPADTQPDNVRAFGYFDADPVVSKRIANETEAIVRLLSGS